MDFDLSSLFSGLQDFLQGLIEWIVQLLTGIFGGFLPG